MISEKGILALFSIYINQNTFAHNQISKMIFKKKKLKKSLVNKLLILHTKIAPYKFTKRKI